MGRFIVIEGLDGAGTTTQTGRLVARLARKHVVHRTFEPSDGPVGRLIRATLAGREGAPTPETLPWMFAADRADHLAREIEPALARGHVVSDRYYHSSLAYQSLTLPLERVHALNRDFRAPDCTVFLEVDPDVALARIQARGGERDLYEHRERLIQIAERYEAVIALLSGLGEPIVRVDGEASADEVEQGVWAAVREVLS